MQQSTDVRACVLNTHTMEEQEQRSAEQMEERMGAVQWGDFWL